jgi:4a-hydroxytetrahydrobiopterin dehydratase
MKPVRMDEQEIEAWLSSVQPSGWQRKDVRWLEKKYRFPSFMEAVQFVVRIGEEAERRNHHPFIAIDYRMVTLQLTTWNAGGLSKLDFESAAAYDDLVTLAEEM